MENQDFSKEIKELRNRKGLSQEELANLAGLSLRTIQRIEKGETNPLGDTKRKIISILESYPDTDFSKRPTTLEKNSFLQRIGIKYDHLLIIHLFSYLGILIGIAVVPIFILISLIFNFLTLIALFMSAVHQKKMKGYKKGMKYFVMPMFTIMVYIFLISLRIPGKTIEISSENGVTTRIERNFITGKSDTTITKQKMPYRPYKSQSVEQIAQPINN